MEHYLYPSALHSHWSRMFFNDFGPRDTFFSLRISFQEFFSARFIFSFFTNVDLRLYTFKFFCLGRSLL